ncbi:MAG: type VI secretion system-associated protein TagF [Gammaproteobacteria bacterium]|nr:type VI secretion system-associated protein TagF [Gammaproteobacteria bacterium]
MSVAQVGVFGKLPMYGDFIQRNLPSGFVAAWDEWLQHFVAGTKEQMGEAWLDIYLTSPIWRFVLSPGVIDKHNWAGILMPSVDHVGRYYPFSVLLRLPDDISLCEFISIQTPWYESVEALALQALEEEMQLDELVENIANIALHIDSGYAKTTAPQEFTSFQINMEFEEQSPSSVYAYFLESLLAKLYPSYSLWATKGSERITPCVFSIRGMPPVNKIPAMLDGQWEHWGWQQPYMLRA